MRRAVTLKNKLNIEVSEMTFEEIRNSLPMVEEVFFKSEGMFYPKGNADAFVKAIHKYDYLKSLKAYGAFFLQKLVGIIAFRNNESHVALFFVDTKYQKIGIGRTLWKYSMDSNTNEEISVHSSIFAKEIYEKLGFVVSGNEVNENGIRFIPMVYHNKIKN